MDRQLTIEIDEGSGFCFGVTTAIRKAEEELAKGTRLYCLGDIVHNGMEVKRLPELWQWIQKLAPRELLVPDDKELPPKCLLEGVRLLRRPVAGFDARKAERRLLEAQSVQELAALGLQN